MIDYLDNQHFSETGGDIEGDTVLHSATNIIPPFETGRESLEKPDIDSVTEEVTSQKVPAEEEQKVDKSLIYVREDNLKEVKRSTADFTKH